MFKGYNTPVLTEHGIPDEVLRSIQPEVVEGQPDLKVAEQSCLNKAIIHLYKVTGDAACEHVRLDDLIQ